MRAFFLSLVLVVISINGFSENVNGIISIVKFPLNKISKTESSNNHKVSPLFYRKAPKDYTMLPVFYFSWGYNKDWYSKSNIYIKQPGLGNDYMLKKVNGHDNIGWDHVFQHDITIPQYNGRVGWFFNKRSDLGFEINFDHTKYQLTEGQSVHQVGTFNGAPIDRNFIVNDTNFFWKLNNGANFLEFNLMKRYRNFSYFNNNFQFFTIFKGGAGPVIPHVQNQIFGMHGPTSFQIGGWNAGVEAAFRLVFFKYAYIEFAQKGVYARYFGLGVYEGKAKQRFFCYEVIGNFGLCFNLKSKPKEEKVQGSLPPVN